MDKQLILIGFLAVVQGLAFVGLFTGRDPETWKATTPAIVTGVFALLRGQNEPSK
jgi:hypothetical protein